MWKFVPRGLRETLERGLNLSRSSETRVGKDKKTYNCCILESFKCITGGSPCCENKYDKQGAYFNKQSWLGAVSCSGALALGWALSQPCLWKKWLFQDNWKAEKLNLAQKLAVVYLQDTKGAILNSEDAVEYGPKTAEEALNEGIEDFMIAHKSIWGEIENQKGIACMDSQEARKAFKHFLVSSKLGYTPAEYNIAQCYELGIGVPQDFTKAAKWYQKAASHGHPTALYNLGVFHAHGWGGLEANAETAKKLLIQAADKGQPDAQAALGRQKPTKPPVLEVLSEDCDSCSCVDLSQDPNHLFQLASDLETSNKDDPTQPSLILQLYKMASDLGHREAKSRLSSLQAYNAIGLLEEYIASKKGQKSTNPSEDEPMALACF